MSKYIPKLKINKAYLYLAIGLALLVLSMMFFFMSVGYMERALISTSLLTAFIGFSLLSSSLYVLRLSAYVYGVEAEGREETKAGK
ncbi:MAG: hypothetical protein B7O98_04530 [Zestosphaera tikiterensis]|uniref:Uncharacterized protein n=1 Tax=Zestosphaera tikiterensis TaxID=1973259 RepID=A0A2R7Y826_9CREN|nr:MAG: hypothetical protein B7O98_04530 [Zestosphaera tikiterensis]